MKKEAKEGQVVVIASRKGHPKAAFIIDGTKISASKIADIRVAAGDMSVAFLRPLSSEVEDLEKVLREMDE